MKFIGIRNAVAGIIVKNGKVFLTKRSELIVDGGKWCLPGGHVKKWETAKDAMKRELKEETGFNVKRLKLLFVHEEFVKRINLHAVVFVFLIETSGKGKNNWEVSEGKFFNKKDIKNLNMAFTHKDVLEKFFNKWRK